MLVRVIALVTLGGLAALMFASAPALAEVSVRAVCGSFKGASHVVQGAGVNNVEVGGLTGGMAGTTSLVVDGLRPEQPFDVIYDDEDGRRSLVEAGARIAAVDTAEGGVALAAVYPNGIIETFHFVGGILVYTQADHGEGLVATSTYIADCRWSD